MSLEEPGLEEAALPVRPAIDGSDVRKLSSGEVPRIARALARAFDDDPVMSWVFTEADRQQRLERAFAFWLRGIWLRQDECYAADRLFGAALWMPPGTWHLGVPDQLRLLPGMVRIHGRTIGRMFALLRLIEQRHPTDPHYYLAVLGVEPELQGRGFGSALMQPVLARCDSERIPAYLESSKERNVVLYERHGFRVVEKLSLPKGGPPLWRMWRDPPES